MSSLLITNGHLVTLDDDNRFIENGSIYIEGNHIIDVGDFSRRTPTRRTARSMPVAAW